MELESLQAELANARSLATIQTVNTLVETLVEAQEKDEEKEYFDKDLGKTIGESIEKIASSLKPVDLTEITKSHESFRKSNDQNQRSFSMLISEVSNQNKKLIEAISDLSKDSKSDNKYQSIIKEVLSVVKRSNELLSKGIEQIDYSKALEKISNRPTEWKFEVFRHQNGKVSEIKATVKK